MTKLSSQALLREHSELEGYVSARAHKDGQFYMFPLAFPAVLFNNHGYVTFDTESSLRKNPLIRTFIGTDGKERLHINAPFLESIHGYVSCGHNHS